MAYLYQPGTRLVKDQVTKLNGQIIHRSTRGIDMLGRSTGMVSRAPDPGAGNAMRIVASVGHRYDAIHRRKDAKREDGTRWDHGYNFKSEVTSANKLLSNSQLVPGQNFAYDYDGMGNRKTSSAGGATTGYSSNGLNQYTSITTPGAVDVLSRSPSPVTATLGGQSASIAQQGNLYNARATLTNAPNGKYYTTSISSGTSTQTGSRWLAPASVIPEYDGDGNLTSDGRWNYTWDAENRLVKMTTRPSAISAGAPNITLDYTNDFMGRRIAEKTTSIPAVGIPSVSETRFLYEAWNPVAEFVVSSSQPTTLTSQRLLLWGLDLSGTPQGAGGVGGLLSISSQITSNPITFNTYLPSYDSNGNIIAWSNHAGQLISRQDYDPFGNTILKESYVPIPGIDAILNYGFSTKPQNGITGLLYYGYRYYDAVMGRWPSRDPIGENGGINLFIYIDNDGLNKIDLLGQFRVGKVPGNWLPKVQKIAGARGWNRLEKLFGKWFSGPSGTLSSPLIVGQNPYDDEIVDMRFVGFFPRASSIRDKLAEASTYQTDRAKKRIRAHLGADVIDGQVVRWASDLPSNERTDHWVEQEKVGKSLSLFPDSLDATLGTFNLVTTIDGCVIKRKSVFKIVISKIAVSVRDQFNFSDEDYLGSWDEPNYFSLIANPNHFSVGDSDFRSWRANNNHGKDFFVLSDTYTKTNKGGKYWTVKLN